MENIEIVIKEVENCDRAVQLFQIKNKTKGIDNNIDFITMD